MQPNSGLLNVKASVEPNQKIKTNHLFYSISTANTRRLLIIFCVKIRFDQCHVLCEHGLKMWFSDVLWNCQIILSVSSWSRFIYRQLLFLTTAAHIFSSFHKRVPVNQCWKDTFLISFNLTMFSSRPNSNNWWRFLSMGAWERLESWWMVSCEHWHLIFKRICSSASTSCSDRHLHARSGCFLLCVAAQKNWALISDCHSVNEALYWKCIKMCDWEQPKSAHGRTQEHLMTSNVLHYLHWKLGISWELSMKAAAGTSSRLIHVSNGVTLLYYSQYHLQHFLQQALAHTSLHFWSQGSKKSPYGITTIHL